MESRSDQPSDGRIKDSNNNDAQIGVHQDEKCLAAKSAPKTASIRKNKNETVRLSNAALLNLHQSTRKPTKVVGNGRCGSHVYLQYTEQKVEVNQFICYQKNETVGDVKHSKGGFRDIIIHHSEDDYAEVLRFRDQLLNINIPDLSVDMFEHIALGKTEMECIFLLNKQYHTVLLFATRAYLKDKLRRRQAECLSLQSLKQGKDDWILPVWVESDVKASLTEWAHIKGIKYYSANNDLVEQQIQHMVQARRH